ncbi:hypothetical protein GA0116948_11644 [Chitinophaga costaii]|uniref:Phosphoribosylpyrophosphate synthetase n=1 Tax=Chitinophaga costaii TaxID=1335309 RepID=A0A1C4FQF8_9BACT|nr:hypothetical protein [Chitinophaga costaii]PUZ20461.1 hypothetical protein DCM91_18680 [Chitinophaga costaii]SCC58198.1 hypothetical protein GA0116948_11644 [Chitinophaga costaii]
MEAYKPGIMTTLSAVMEKMRKNGFDHELKMSDHGRMQSADTQKIYNPDELTIIKTYRFEGESDPSDSSILYLLEDKDGDKSYLLDAYGTYSTHDEAGFDEFMQKIPVEDREDQLLFG